VFGKETMLHAVYISVILVLAIVIFSLIAVLWRIRGRLGKFGLRKISKGICQETKENTVD